MTKQKMSKKRLVKGATLGLLSFAALLDVFGIGQKDKVYADTNTDPNDGQKNPEGTTVVSDESQTVETKSNLSVTTEPAPETPAPVVESTDTTPEQVSEPAAPVTEEVPAVTQEVEDTPQPVETPAETQTTNETPEPIVSGDDGSAGDINVSQETSPTPVAEGTNDDVSATGQETPPEVVPEAADADAIESEAEDEQGAKEATTDTTEQAQPASLATETPAEVALADATENSYQLVNANNGSSLHDLYINYLKKDLGITDAAKLEELANKNAPESMNITEGTVLKAITIGGTVYLPVLESQDATDYLNNLKRENIDALTLTATAPKLSQANGKIKYIAVNTIVPNGSGSNANYVDNVVNNTISIPSGNTDYVISKGVEITQDSQSVAWVRDPETGLASNEKTVTSDIQFGYKYDENGDVIKIPSTEDVTYAWGKDNFAGGTNGFSSQAYLTLDPKTSPGYTGINSYTDDKIVFALMIGNTEAGRLVMNDLDKATDPLYQYSGVIRDGVGNLIRFRLEDFYTQEVSVDTSQYEDDTTVHVTVEPEEPTIQNDVVATQKARYFAVSDLNGAVTNVTPIEEDYEPTSKFDLNISKAKVGPDNSVVVLLNDHYYKINLNLTGKVNYKQSVTDKNGNVTTEELGLGSKDATLGTAFSEAPEAPEGTTYKGMTVSPDPSAETVAWGTTTVTYNYAADLEVTQNATVLTTDEDNHTVAVTADEDKTTAFDDFKGYDLADTNEFTITKDADTKILSITATETGFNVVFDNDTTTADHVITVKNKKTGTNYTLNITLQGQVIHQKMLDGNVIAISDPTEIALSTSIPASTPDVAETGTHYVETTANPDTTTVGWGTTTITDHYATDHMSDGEATVDTSKVTGHEVTVEAGETVDMTSFNGEDLMDETKFTITDKSSNITGISAKDNKFDVTFDDKTTTASHKFTIRNNETGETYTQTIMLQGRVVTQKVLDDTTPIAIDDVLVDLETELTFDTPEAAEKTHYERTDITPTGAVAAVWGTTTVTYHYATDHVSEGEATVDTSKVTGREVSVKADTNADMNAFMDVDTETPNSKYTVTPSNNSTILNIKTSADGQGFDVTFADDTTTASHEFTVRNNETGETYTQTITLKGTVMTQNSINGEVIAESGTKTPGDLGAAVTISQPTAPEGAYHLESIAPAVPATFTWGTTTVTYNYVDNAEHTQKEEIKTYEPKQVTDHTAIFDTNSTTDFEVFSNQDDLLNNANFKISGSSDITKIKTTVNTFEITFADNTATAKQTITIQDKATGANYTLDLTLKGRVSYLTNEAGTVRNFDMDNEDLGSNIRDLEAHRLEKVTVPEGMHYVGTTMEPDKTDVFVWGVTRVTYCYEKDNVTLDTQSKETQTKDYIVTFTPVADADMTSFINKTLVDGTDFTVDKDNDITGITADENGFHVTFKDTTDTPEHHFKVRNNETGETYTLNINLQGTIIKQNAINDKVDLDSKVTDSGALSELANVAKPDAPTATNLHEVAVTEENGDGTKFVWGTTTVTYNYVTDNVISDEQTKATVTDNYTVNFEAKTGTDMSHFENLDNGDFSIDKDDDIETITTNETGFQVTFKNTTNEATHNFKVRNNKTGETYELDITLQGTVIKQNTINGKDDPDSKNTTTATENLGTAVELAQPTAPEGAYHLESIAPAVPATFTWGTTIVTYNYVDNTTHVQTEKIDTGDNAIVTGHNVTIQTDNTTEFADFANTEFTDNADYEIIKPDDVIAISTDDEGFTVTFAEGTATADQKITIRNKETGATYQLDLTLHGRVKYVHNTDETRATKVFKTDTQALGTDLDIDGHRPEALAGTHYVNTTVEPEGTTFVWGTTTVTYNYVTDPVVTEDSYTQDATVNTNDPAQTKGHTVTVDSDQLAKFVPFENQADLLNDPNFEVVKDKQIIAVTTTQTGFTITFAEDTATPTHTLTLKTDNKVYILNLTLTGDVQYDVIWPDGTHHLITDPSILDSGQLTDNGALGANLPTQTIDDAFVKAHGDVATQAMLASGNYQLLAVTPDPTQTKFVWGGQTLQIKYGVKAITPEPEQPGVTNPDTWYPTPDPEPTPVPTPDPEPTPEIPVDPEEPEVPEVPVDPEEPEVPEVPVEPEEPEQPVTPDPEPEAETAGNVATGNPRPTPLDNRPNQGTAGLTRVADRVTAKQTGQTLPQTGDDQAEASRLSALGALGVLGGLFGGGILNKKRKKDNQ